MRAPFVLVLLCVVAGAAYYVSRPRAVAVVAAQPAASDTRAAAVAPSRDEHDDELAAIHALSREQRPEVISRMERLLLKLDGDPRHELVACELAVLLNNRATEQANAHQSKGADVDSARAVELCGSNRQITANRANMLFSFAMDEDRKSHEGRVRAEAFLEKGLALDEQPNALANLAELLYADDDVNSAVKQYTRALEIGKSEQWQHRLDELTKKAAVEGAFSDRKHEHFVARFEGYAQEQLAWTALDELEEAYFSIGRALDVFPKEPITVVIYTGDQYKRAVDVPDWSSGVFDGKIRVAEGQLAAERGHLRAILRHEYTHAVLATLPTPVPTWMNEGLAEHFEGTDADRSTRACAAEKAHGNVVTYRDLCGSFVAIQESARAQLAYAASTSLVDSLVQSRGAYALVTFASHLKNGEAFDDAFRATFAITPEQHFERWSASL